MSFNLISPPLLHLITTGMSSIGKCISRGWFSDSSAVSLLEYPTPLLHRPNLPCHSHCFWPFHHPISLISSVLISNSRNSLPCLQKA